MIIAKKIMIVANNPGGANAIIPLLPWLSNYKLILTAQTRDLTEKKSLVVPYNLSAHDIRKLLSIEQPAALVTGTSVPSSPGGDLENIFREQANALNIPSIAILDHWANYSRRFSNDGEIKSDYLPGTICIMDRRAQKEMLEEGFPPHILRITGQPAFDELMNNDNNTSHHVKTIRKTMGILNDNKAIGFVSKPLSDDYKTYSDYTEITVLNLLVKQLEDLYFTGHLSLHLHPRDNPSKFLGLIGRSNLNITNDTDIPATDWIMACDLVVGMTSVLLGQAIMRGRPTLSIQPNVSNADPRIKIVYPLRSINSESQLQMILSDWIHNNVIPETPFPIYNEANARGKVIEVISEAIA